MPPLYILDLLGTFAFAVYGSHVAQTKRLDLFGIIACAFVTGFGGGTIRELFLNTIPTYFYNSTYTAVVFLGVVFSILTYRYFASIRPYMLWIDALGLVTVAYIGASRAAEAGLGFIGILIFATLSAVGGGVLRDVLIREVPEVLYQDFYATPAIVLGVGYYIIHMYANYPWAGYILLCTIFIIRIFAIKLRIQMWKPNAGI